MRWLLSLILMPFAFVRAGDFQPVEEIVAAAVASRAGQPGLRVEAAVDSGMRLPRCHEPLSAVSGAGDTVEVACPSAGWRLYVPLKLQRLQQVYVLRRPLAAGVPIADDAVSIETRDVTRIPGGVLAVGELAGQTARRSLLAGAVLTVADTQSVRLLRRGDPVVLVSRLGGIEVRASGKALAAAGLNERVAVENASSRRIVQGVLQANGEVLVR